MYLSPPFEIRRGADGVAERAVERRRVLGRVREDAGELAAGAVERCAHRADAPVHHVRRRDHVHAGLGVTQRLLHQRGHGRLVLHVAGVVDEAVLAVAGVRIERDVGDHAEVGKALLQRAHGARHQSFGMPRRRGIERLLPPAARPETAPSAGIAQRRACFGIAQQEVERSCARRRAATRPVPRASCRRARTPDR